MQLVFLFRLDLILDACVIHIQCDSFGILNFTSKPDLGLIVAHLWLRIHFDWLRFEWVICVWNLSFVLPLFFVFFWRDARRRELLAAALTRQPAAANAAAGLRRLASNGRYWFSAREQRGERWRWEPVRAAALRRGARGRPARPAAQLAARFFLFYI